MNKQVEALMPTDWGTFRMISYADSSQERMPHVAMVHPEMDPTFPVHVRIHSECMTGDLFHSNRCDCGEQLDAAMHIAAAEKGMVIYLRQEGRGIGIINKLHAYNLQDQGYNTVEANMHLGLEIDDRRYELAIQILEDLGVKRIFLLTNNPLKVKALEQSTVQLAGRVPIIIPPNEGNRAYLKTKQEEMGHLLEV